MQHRARIRRLALPVLGLVLLLPLGTARSAERLDKKGIQTFAKAFFKERPWTRFQKWEMGARPKHFAAARAHGSIPEGSLEQVVALLMKAARKAAPRLTKSEFETPYGKATWIQSGRGGKKAGLLIGLHGGGEGAGSAGEAAGNWSMPKTLGMYPQGIRLVHDTWNTVHGERFVISLIELAKARYEIDPDRVYVAGFSMGGTGSYHMAGRWPDLFAGAIPAHGVVMAEPKSQVDDLEEIKSMQHGLLPNLRNLAVYSYTGYEDKNCKPWTFVYAWNLLKELKESDPEGYQDLRFEVHEGLAHAFPPGEPGKGVKFVTARKRNTFPTKLTWEYAAHPYPLPDGQDKVERIQQHWFYWLHCKQPADTMAITATRKGNEFDLEITIAFPDDFTIYMNPEMIDVKKDVVVRVDGKEVYRGKPEPTFAAVVESLDAKMDRRMVFDRKVVIPEPE